MNRTALAVVALAVGAVLIIGLFNIYRPEIDHLTSDIFSRIEGSLNGANMDDSILPTLGANLGF